MSARKYTTDKGIPVYCSDIIKAVRCPYTGELVDVSGECYKCNKRYQETNYHVYCVETLEIEGKR